MKLKNSKFKLTLIFLVIIVINFTMLEIACCDNFDNCKVVGAKTSLHSKGMVEPIEVVEEQPKNKNTRVFIATAYCICYKCCGKTPDHPAYGITASGKRATPNRTIAVDTNTIPLGATVIVDGVEYVAEDTGSAIRGNRIDICFENHETAKQYGRRTVNVEVIY